jgi:hypothetical protein
LKTKQNLIQIGLIVALLIMQMFICEAQPVATNIAAGLYHSLVVVLLAALIYRFLAGRLAAKASSKSNSP